MVTLWDRLLAREAVRLSRWQGVGRSIDARDTHPTFSKMSNYNYTPDRQTTEMTESSRTDARAKAVEAVGS